MKIEVGMYVRTRDGIVKINHSINQGVGLTFIDGLPRQDSDILKASFNLIDLIEVGDLVELRDTFYGRANDRFFIKDGNEDDSIEETKSIIDKAGYEIKSILTHEQYEANKYVVEKVSDE